jgi:predicted nucleotide-binding protein
MAKINQDLIARLMKKLGVSKSRVYALVQESANRNRVRRHIGALLLAGDNGISIQKYATAEDHSELRGIVSHAPTTTVAGPRSSQHPGRAQWGKAVKAPKTKENTVFVVHGRDSNLRDAMYEFLGALGLKPQEWGHAIRAARGKGANPYVNDAVAKVMEQAQAIVVMLSSDDEAKLKDQFVTKHERQTEGRLRGQARPNVIFETGIAIGTHHKKTVMVQVGNVKPFTDVGGMHIPHFTGDSRSRHDLANRLADLGCKINREGDHWLRAGYFTPTAPKPKPTRRGSYPAVKPARRRPSLRLPVVGLRRRKRARI